jgi:hypothetical protein
MEAVRRSSLVDGHLPPLPAIAYPIAAAASVGWLGAVVFKQQERSFADVI